MLRRYVVSKVQHVRKQTQYTRTHTRTREYMRTTCKTTCTTMPWNIGTRNCLTEYTVHSLSNCYGLLPWCCWTMMPDGVIQHKFLQKCVILHSCVHGRRKDFPGGSSWFFEKFCRRAKKWRNMFFYHLKWRKQHFLLKCSNSCPLPTMPVTNLGHQGRWRVFWEGPKFFKLCPIVLNYVQHIFPRRAKIVSRAKAPLVTGLLPTPMLVCRKKFVPHHLKIGVISSVLTPF